MSYQTKQQDLILAALRHSDAPHVTAAQLVAALQESGTPVSPATVYRQLEKLSADGKVRKYLVDERQGACYQYVGDSGRCAEHFHLKCTVCGTLYHESCDALEELGAHLLEHHGFAIDHTKTVLYGTCAACRRAGKDTDR